MKKTKIVEGPEDGRFASYTGNTQTGQREKLEEIIKNLAQLSGEQTVFKKTSTRGTDFYRIGSSSYQSATNTILELSRNLVENA